MRGATKQPPVLGPAARMRCQRCGRVFTVRPGHVIAHDRRQGAVYVQCDGDLVADVTVVAGDTATSAIKQ